MKNFHRSAVLLVLSNTVDNRIWNLLMVIIFSDNCNLLLPVSVFVVLTSHT